MIASAATKGKVTLNNVEPLHLTSVIAALEESGSIFYIDKNKITINSNEIINPINLITDVYPGFPTDLQAQWIALMLKANGTSKITDTIYLDRFTHVPELNRLGADISMDSNTAIINGVDELFGTNVMSTDIRASASLIIAAIISNGVTELSRIYHIDRGYENIENKLTKLNVNIKRINERDLWNILLQKIE